MDFSAPLAPKAILGRRISDCGMGIVLAAQGRTNGGTDSGRKYTAELESKLRHLQSEGIKATLEVQAAARKVFEDNLRLKALLRSAGIDEPTINTGTPRGAISNPSPAEGQSTSTTETSTHLSGSETSLSPCDEKQAHGLEDPYASPSKEPNHDILDADRAVSNDCSTELSPCKLMSRLAENPDTDLTQIGASDHQVEEDEADGVECSKAYKMLIQFVMTEEKLDTISRALESGCTKGSKGGCKIRNEAIWKAIDDGS